MRNEIAAIRRPGLLDADDCTATAEVLTAAGFGFYADCYPPVGRMGITQYEHFGKKQEYFEKAPAAMKLREELLQEVSDPQRILLDELSAAWSAPVGIAEEHGVPYFAGVFRSSSGDGTPMHADWGPRDGEDWLIGQIQAQLGWNLYYSVPDDGGDLIVYNYPWVPEVEAHARQRFNDYDPALFTDTEFYSIHPRPGELVIFNARNVHAVSASTQGNERVSVGSFIGEMPDRSLVFWS